MQCPLALFFVGVARVLGFIKYSSFQCGKPPTAFGLTLRTASGSLTIARRWAKRCYERKARVSLWRCTSGLVPILGSHLWIGAVIQLPSTRLQYMIRLFFPTLCRAVLIYGGAYSDFLIETVID
ncbi:hypothetical protein CPB85DRAFT_998875 [Mucidula mucida]|nr:hypothetical protein CPB85DRAFT_998875 [Mucidula mucida]